jgi:cobalt-zinc-cadmium efflux system membrane fusion protein
MNRLLAVAALLLPIAAFAHGGEDHGEPAAPPAGAALQGQRAAYGQTATFEVTLQFAPPAEGQDASVMVYVADYATNAPVPDAKVEIELTGAAPVKAVAEATPTPGAYHLVARVPPAKYAAIATVQAGERLDLVELKEVDFSVATPAVAEPHERAPWGLVAGVVAAVLLALLLVRALRRRRHPEATVAALLLTVPLLARAHGGEDHGAAPPPATPAPAGGGIYVPKPSQFLLGIRTAPVAERSLQPRLRTLGRIVPRVDGQAQLRAPVAGRIVPIDGRLPLLGDTVVRGQPLVEIDQVLGAAESGQVQAEGIRARSAIGEAQARRDQARRDLDRLRSLQGIVAQKEIQQAQLEVTLAEKELARARAEAQVFGRGLRRVAVASPIDGVVAETANAAAGNVVAPDQPLYTVVDAASLWVEADVFAADLPRVEPSSPADVRVEGDDTVYRGTVFRIGQVVSPTTRTAKVIVAVDNPNGKLRPGVFADVALGAGPEQRRLAVPDDAVVEEGGRRFVFVHTAPEAFVRREVVLGSRDGAFWAVEQGLARGERVVVQGTYPLRTSR